MSKDSSIIGLNERIVAVEGILTDNNHFDSLTASTVSDLQNRIYVLESKNDTLSQSDLISGLSFLLSLLTAICLVSYYFYGKLKIRQRKFRKKLSGKWTTEGDITMSQPLPYLNFELDVDIEDGEITGLIEPLQEECPSVLSINGKLNYNKATINITHFSRGKILDYGKVRLTLRGKLLIWDTLKGDRKLYPLKVIAWKLLDNSKN